MQRLVLLASSSCRVLAPLLSSVRRAMEEHAAKLRLPSTVIEVGSNNSPEPLNQGFNIAAVVSVAAGRALSHDHASSFSRHFIDVCSAAAASSLESTPAASPHVLTLLFTATPSPHCSSTGFTPAPPPSIRHFVAWKFLPDAAPGAVAAAVAGYMNLPQSMPYFSSLEVGPETSRDPCYSVCLYSTFHDAHAQEAFVHDERRIAFKQALVQPHLAANGVLVFDFLPLAE
jgi:hypothetical protein